MRRIETKRGFDDADAGAMPAAAPTAKAPASSKTPIRDIPDPPAMPLDRPSVLAPAYHRRRPGHQGISWHLGDIQARLWPGEMPLNGATNGAHFFKKRAVRPRLKRRG